MYFLILEGVFFVFEFFMEISDSGSDFIITNCSTIEFGNEPYVFTYYLLIKLVSIIFVFVKSYAIVYTLITFNRNIYETLLYRLLRGPINLFHNIVLNLISLIAFQKILEILKNIFGP